MKRQPDGLAGIPGHVRDPDAGPRFLDSLPSGAIRSAGVSQRPDLLYSYWRSHPEPCGLLFSGQLTVRPRWTLPERTNSAKWDPLDLFAGLRAVPSNGNLEPTNNREQDSGGAGEIVHRNSTVAGQFRNRRTSCLCSFCVVMIIAVLAFVARP